MTVPFLDLQANNKPLRDEILAEWEDIFDSCQFVSGSRVRAFETAFAQAHESSHAVAVSNGTTALEVALRALGIGCGDGVVVPANTFIATAEAVSNVGATPVFVDCDPNTRTIAVDAATEAMASSHVRAVIPVHLYGQPADMDPIIEAAAAHGVAVIEDAAQAHFAQYKGRKVGSIGNVGCFSFYPGKNLGAPGEGGAITTSDPGLSDAMRSLRDHGQSEKYHSDVVGTNARMSELVASTLSVKLRHLEGWTDARRQVADWYRSELAGLANVAVFDEPEWAHNVYHLFVIELDGRDGVHAALNDAGIGVALHYPVPVHRQVAYSFLGYESGSFPNAERSAARLLSLPMFPEMTRSQVAIVADQLKRVVANESRDTSVEGGIR